MVDNIVCDHCSNEILNTEIYNDGIKRLFWCQSCIAIDGWKIEKLLTEAHPSEPFRFARTHKGCDGIDREYRYHFFCSNENIKIISDIPKIQLRNLKVKSALYKSEKKYSMVVNPLKPIFTCSICGKKHESNKTRVFVRPPSRGGDYRFPLVPDTLVSFKSGNSGYTLACVECAPKDPDKEKKKDKRGKLKDAQEHFSKKEKEDKAISTNQKPEHRPFKDTVKELEKLITPYPWDLIKKGSSLPELLVGNHKQSNTPDRPNPKGCGCLGQCTKNLYISAYRGNYNFGFMAPGHRYKDSQYLRLAEFLEQHFPMKMCYEIIQSLQEQQDKNIGYPNLTIFMDTNGAPMGIDDYMRKFGKPKLQQKAYDNRTMNHYTFIEEIF